MSFSSLLNVRKLQMFSLTARSVMRWMIGSNFVGADWVSRPV